MKTSIFLAACLSISFLACDRETDYLTPGDLQFSKTNANNAMVIDAGGTSTKRNECIELSTTHWLIGTGKLEPIREKAINEVSMDNISQGRYSIEASGDAMSELYARGFSELKLIYDSRTYTLTGTLTTTFYYGEILDMKLNGVARVGYGGTIMKITAKVIEATFKTGKEELVLDNGEITFELPLKPEGQFTINANTKALLCK